MKIKQLQQVNEHIKKLDLTKKNVQEALHELQDRVSKAEEASNAPQIREKISEIQLELREIALVKSLKKHQEALDNIELEIEPVQVKGKIGIPEEISELLVTQKT